MRPCLVALLVATGVLYLWNLSASGMANSFYASAVQAGTQSWKAMLFGSLDAGNAITAMPTTPASAVNTPASARPTTPSSCVVIPDETSGPFPGDGSNGPNVLTQSGIVRSDLRSSFGSYSGAAAGVLTTVRLTLLNQAGSCRPLSGAAVYLWHCDQAGRYSLYSQGATDQNYLRGVQATDSSGQVSFQTIFPAAYDGRWPHMHFEVYPSLGKATSSGNKIATSQLALPEATSHRASRPRGTSSRPATWTGPRWRRTWSSGTTSRSTSWPR